MSYAIIETGGKQLRVEASRFYDIERLPVEAEEKVSIDKVLFVQHNGDVHIGQPLVAGATVEGTVLRQFRGRKVLVYKMRPKKKTRKKRGHRQEITQLMIDSINLNGTVLASAETTAEVVIAEKILDPAPESAPESVPESVPESAPAETTVEVASTEVASTPTEAAVEAPADPGAETPADPGTEAPAETAEAETQEQ
ncbi:MAG: 50S ribosomal protein L21 [Hormoscilla sp. SP5CHS1]|nr:50S ribosomal protein L21 [Hormoscilla sp. SP12CHS1]MBC6452075.1 50S ribosomal protein L21 [Hormoscilla sp. SP5CHS1]